MSTQTSKDLRQAAPDVSLAEPGDIVGLLETMRKAHALLSADMPFPEPDVPYCMQAMLDQIAMGHVFVARSGGRIVGVIALAVHRWPWTAPSNTAGHYLTNEHFWVDPVYRRWGTARRLLGEAARLSDGLGIPLMIDMSSGGADAPLKDRFVKTQGFMYVGGKHFRAPRKAH